MEIKAHQIPGITGGVTLHDILNFPIARIWTDTRTIQSDDLFVALSGPSFNAHDFLEEAARLGVKNFIIQDVQKIPSHIKDKYNFFIVPDTLKAYGDLAAFYRAKFKIPVVAITGSSGKTTTKELLAHLLNPHFKVLKNRGTENNLVGVPKTIFELTGDHEILVLELGTNSPGEIARLAQIAKPTMALITAVGLSHLEGLKNLEGVYLEKTSLINHLDKNGVLILNGEDPMLDRVESKTHKTIRVGFDGPKINLLAKNLESNQKGLSFYLGTQVFESQLLGRHNALNILSAVQAAQSLGAEASEIKKSLLSFAPVPGRMQIKEINGIYFINDTYNANPTSFRAALQALKSFKVQEKKVVICADMLELGAHSQSLHEEMGVILANFSFDLVIAVGPLCRHLVNAAIKNGFDSNKIYHANDSIAAGRLCQEKVSARDFVLVKGSRRMQMEKIFECYTTSSIH